MRLGLFIDNSISNGKMLAKRHALDARFLTYTYFRRLKKSYLLADRKKLGTILEVGCGSGMFISANHKRKIVGLDINLETLKIIKKHNPGISLVQADARRLPFKDNVFDCVVSLSVLEHVYHPEMIIREIYRIVRKKSFVSTQVDDTIPFIYDPVNSVMRRLFKKRCSSFGVYGMGHCSMFNTQAWLRTFSSCGFAKAKAITTNNKTYLFECLEYVLFSPLTFRKRYEDLPIKEIPQWLVKFLHIFYVLIEKIDFPVFMTDKIIRFFILKK